VVTYFSKKRGSTRGEISPGLWMCTATLSPAPSTVTVTTPPSGAASIAFFTRLASIE
jgi:hypothetical protein